MNCASIHRKLGTHITKVKSMTMDTWTKEQVEVMKNMGNAKSNAIYNPNEARHPPPPNLEDGERDSEMEQYIRAKYEYRKFLDKSALAASKLGPSRSAATATPRSVSSPLTSNARSSTIPAGSSLRNPPIQDSKPSLPTSAPKPTPQPRSVSQPVVAPLHPQQQQPPAGSVWNDLIQLQDSSAPSTSTLPLQFSAQPTLGSTTLTPSFTQPTHSANPTGFNPFQMQLQPQFTSASFSSPFTPGFHGAMQPSSSFGQQLFMNHTAMPGFAGGGGLGTPTTQPAQFFQPQPQSATLPTQTPPAHQGFLTPSPSQGMMSAPVSQTHFITPSPQQFLSASPQPQAPVMGFQPQVNGMFMSTPSPQPMSMGMMPNGTSPSPIPGMMGGGMGMHPTGQFGGGMMQQQQQQQQGQFMQGLPAGMLSPANFQAATGNNPFGHRHGTM